MYFVDREKIEETLRYLEGLINLFSSHKNWSTPLEKVAMERLCHLMIESVLDVGNAMIDGFIMRDPGSYEDIIDILIDEKVVSQETGASLKALIHYRKILVQDYLAIDHGDISAQFAQNLFELVNFAENVRGYLTHELGPVSAFKN
ncbi:DUF86 domain-containing protein [Neobacillus jeddahensis]|uniref:DUF86 domain-containing protein n=1 Tax=Neobacillus jeddahensis TaxID=1461580 RepID=UPI0005900963|nr:DUF86 domain-containing protein [Neobacillus jeddahensis]